MDRAELEALRERVAGLTDRERQVIAWMADRTPQGSDALWYTDEIGTSARLLSGLERRGLVCRHDPHGNPFVRSGSMSIRWGLTQAGVRCAGLDHPALLAQEQPHA